jgi:DNA-binding NarL/FixJ family response regulator
VAEAARKGGFRSAVAISLRCDGEVSGRLCVASTHERQFARGELELLANIRELLGLATRNAVLFARVQRRNQELATLVAGGRAGASSLDLSEILDAAARIMEEFSRLSRDRREKDVVQDELTERELQVLRLVANGATNREIAVSLYVSENTVNFHMKNIFAKLRVKNRAQAATYAIRTGLVELPRSHVGAPGR